jgi:hypothetical protein
MDDTTHLDRWLAERRDRLAKMGPANADETAARLIRARQARDEADAAFELAHTEVVNAHRQLAEESAVAIVLAVRVAMAPRRRWRGSCTDLLATFGEPFSGLFTPQMVGVHLRRVVGDLREIGIEVKIITKGVRSIIHIARDQARPGRSSVSV